MWTESRWYLQEPEQFFKSILNLTGSQLRGALIGTMWDSWWVFYYKPDPLNKSGWEHLSWTRWWTHVRNGIWKFLQGNSTELWAGNMAKVRLSMVYAGSETIYFIDKDISKPYIVIGWRDRRTRKSVIYDLVNSVKVGSGIVFVVLVFIRNVCLFLIPELMHAHAHTYVLHTCSEFFYIVSLRDV